jgi:hypothetical protein
LTALVPLVAACGPFGDNDGNPPRQPTATREIVVATFTPTEVVPPDIQPATSEARETAAALTATEIAVNPPPTPTFANPTVPEDLLLTPPNATLASPAGEIAAVTGSYAWSYSDHPTSVVEIQAPMLDLLHAPVTIANGSELTLSLFGRVSTAPRRSGSRSASTTSMRTPASRPTHKEGPPTSRGSSSRPSRIGSSTSTPPVPASPSTFRPATM